MSDMNLFEEMAVALSRNLQELQYHSALKGSVLTNHEISICRTKKRSSQGKAGLANRVQHVWLEEQDEVRLQSSLRGRTRRKTHDTSYESNKLKQTQESSQGRLIAETTTEHLEHTPDIPGNDCTTTANRKRGRPTKCITKDICSLIGDANKPTRDRPSWNERFEQLTKYFHEHKHCNIVASKRGEPYLFKLALWLKNQRAFLRDRLMHEKKGKIILSEEYRERIRKLNDLHAIFDSDEEERLFRRCFQTPDSSSVCPSLRAGCNSQADAHPRHLEIDGNSESLPEVTEDHTCFSSEPESDQICEVTDISGIVDKSEADLEVSSVANVWTVREYELLLAGYKEFGTNWEMVSATVKTRSSLEVGFSNSFCTLLQMLTL